MGVVKVFFLGVGLTQEGIFSLKPFILEDFQLQSIERKGRNYLGVYIKHGTYGEFLAQAKELTAKLHTLFPEKNFSLENLHLFTESLIS